MKAILFDYDGVLTKDKTGTFTTISFLSRYTELPYERLVAAIGEHNSELNVGTTTYAAIWPKVCASLGRPLPLELLLAAYESTPLNDEMLSLARELKSTYAVGIITDNKKERMDHLRKYQELDKVFVPIVVSAEVGCTKASPAIFEHALAQLKLPPHECVFIDNARGNLAVARELGMGTIYFDDQSNDIPGLLVALSSQFGVAVAGAA